MEYELATKECALHGLRSELVHLIERHQIQDDPVLRCFHVRADKKSGGCISAIVDIIFLGILEIFIGKSNAVHNWVHAITKQKVISAYFDDENKDSTYEGGVESMNLIDIVNIAPDWYGNYLWPVAKVTGTGGATLGLAISFEARQMLIDVLQRAVDEAKLHMQQSQERTGLSESGINTDIAKRLQRLTDLYQQKAITEVEYQQRRKAILNQL